MDHVQRFRQRRIQRLEKRYGEHHGPVRFDADDDSESDNGGNRSGSSGGHGNTKIPYGLCQREGIKIGKDWTPKDAWDALAGKGYSASDVYKELKTTGRVEPRQPKEPEKPKMDKKQIDSAIKSYSDKKKEIKKLNNEFKKVDKEFDEARLDNNFESNKLDRILKQVEEFNNTHDFDKIENWEEREKALAERDELYKRLKEQTKVATDAYNRKEELKNKIAEIKTQIGEAEKARDEAESQCYKAIESSPIYDNVMKYREAEEETRADRKLLEHFDTKARLWNDTLNETLERYERAKVTHGEDSSYARLIAGNISNYRKYYEANKAKADELRPRVSDGDRRMREAMDGINEKEWKSIHDLSIERDTVKDGPYDKIASIAHSFKLNLKYVAPVKYVKTPPENTIINSVGGGDETKGSCASLAFAYLANKQGYHVLDFRGGKSQDFMSRRCNEMVWNLGGQKVKSQNEPKDSMDVLNSIDEGKEYWFATGRHAAVVRKTGGKVQYLELQSFSTSNGWKTLDESEIKDRFKGKRYGTGKSGYISLISADQLFGTNEAVSIMGYINTLEDKQKKGASGGIK